MGRVDLHLGAGLGLNLIGDQRRQPLWIGEPAVKIIKSQTQQQAGDEQLAPSTAAAAPRRIG